MTRLTLFLLPLALLAASQPAQAQQWRERRYERPPLDVYWDGDCRIERRVNRYGEVVERRRCPEPEPRAAQTYEREPEPPRTTWRNDAPEPAAYAVQRDERPAPAPEPAPARYVPLPARIVAQDRPVTAPIPAKPRVAALPPPKPVPEPAVSKRPAAPPPAASKPTAAPLAAKRASPAVPAAARQAAQPAHVKRAMAAPKLAAKPVQRPAPAIVSTPKLAVKPARPATVAQKVHASLAVKPALQAKVARNMVKSSPARVVAKAPLPVKPPRAVAKPERLAVRTFESPPAREVRRPAPVAPVRPLIAAAAVKAKPPAQTIVQKSEEDVAAASVASKVEHVTKTKGNYPAPDWLVIVEPEPAKPESKPKPLPDAGKPVQASNHRLSVKAERDLLLRDYEDHIWRESKNPYSNLK